MAESLSARKQETQAKTHQVHRKDLPLSCPTADMELWNMHPKVYLPIEKSGKATCPYCGAEYELVD